jgi:hypothetical protein
MTHLESDEAGGVEQDVDFTPVANQRESRPSGSASHANEDEEDFFRDDPPSITLREILLNADTSHFHLLGLSKLLNFFFLYLTYLLFRRRSR